jgi:general secretion pathway protein L
MSAVTTRSPVARFLAWWGRELASLLPAAWRDRFGNERLIVDLAEGEARFTRMLAGKAVALGSAPAQAGRGEAARRLLAGVPLADTPVLLRLGGGQALAKTVTLPLAAEENLQEVLGFEMERLTPFRAEQVRFAHAIAERRPAEKSLRVDLVVVPRERLASARDLLLEWGVPVDRVQAAPPAPPLDLAPAEWHRRSGPAGRRIRLLAAATAALALLAVVSPLARHSLSLAATEARIAELRPTVDAVLRAQAEVDNWASGAQRVARLKREAPSATRLLDEFTRLLPDDTWVSQFNLVDRTVELQGTTASAAALVGLIEASPVVAKVRFRTPITSDPVTRLERFELAVELKPS